MNTTIHLEYEGKTARLPLQSPKRAKAEPVIQRRTSSGSVTTARIFNATSKVNPATFTADDLVKSDPELDLSMAGMVADTDLLCPAFLNDAGEVVQDFEEIEVVLGVDGAEKERRPRTNRAANINDVRPLKVGKLMSAEEALTEGGEGIVVRNEKERDFSKIKPRLTIDAAIMGYVEGSFDGKIGVRNLLVGLTYPEKDGETVYQSLARIGSGLDDKTSVDLLVKLQGMKVAPPVLLNDSEGREVHFVKPELIVEVEGEDWIHQRTDGRPVRSQAFSWNEKNGEWIYAGVGPCPRLVFPAFSKLRDDKSIGAGGARIAQALETATLPPEPVELSEPEMVERQVYRKGKDAVRKFILAKRGGEDTLPYIVCFTDFSAGRKEPLKVSTEYALNEKRARELFDAAVKENVKKGWEKV